MRKDCNIVVSGLDFDAMRSIYTAIDFVVRLVAKCTHTQLIEMQVQVCDKRGESREVKPTFIIPKGASAPPTESQPRARLRLL